MGEALRGRAAAVCLHLQHRERHGGASHPQPLLCTGGVQRGPAGHAEGASSSTRSEKVLFLLSGQAHFEDMELTVQCWVGDLKGEVLVKKLPSI